MTLSVKHAFTSAKGDSGDPTLIQPSNWNAEHTITAASGKVLGRDTSSAGAIQELPIAVDPTGQSVVLPSGTTAQRPISPVLGMKRFNTTTGLNEQYLASGWASIGVPDDGSVTTAKLATDAVTQVKMADNSVGTAELIDNNITLAKLAAAVQTLLVPAGAMMNFGGSTIPTGWLQCYGQAVSRATYAALFTAIGTVHGAGDGSTTFNLPDARGRVLAGLDNMGGTSANRLTNPGSTGGMDGDILGNAGGQETHVLTIGEMPSHNFSITLAHSHGANGNSSTNWSDGDTGGGSNTGTTNTLGSNTPHNVVQPTLITNVIIKI